MDPGTSHDVRDPRSGTSTRPMLVRVGSLRSSQVILGDRESSSRTIHSWPMAKGMGANEYITIAAALGGGVFGDHCSPISDTTILSSMASASDHIDHVKTQFPYALVAGGLTALFYLIIGG